MKRQQIILIGGGGHAKVIIDAIQAGEKWEIVGVIDAELPLGSKIADIEIIGRD